ncbi:MAG: hypothetical protein J5J00_02325 [Deltaproteobacteria bacterium]|nr:hypothetical protein [Deltaproteobacteria bacterium]
MDAARRAFKNELQDDQFPDMPVARIASLINKAQNSVSPELLDAVNLRYVQRRPWHVVAFMLNCSEKKAKERVREGRDALKIEARYYPPDLR